MERLGEKVGEPTQVGLRSYTASVQSVVAPALRGTWGPRGALSRQIATRQWPNHSEARMSETRSNRLVEVECFGVGLLDQVLVVGSYGGHIRAAGVILAGMERSTRGTHRKQGSSAEEVCRPGRRWREA